MSGLYSQGPMPTERDTTMRDLLAVVFKRKWMILLFFGVACFVVGAKVVNTPETYTGDVTIMLQRDFRSSVLQTNPRALPWVEVMESEVEVALSVPVLELARAQLLKPTPRIPDGLDISLSELSESVSAGMVGESNVLYISGTASSPLEAVRLANTVARAYVKYHDELFKLPEASSFIRAQADSSLQQLELLQGEREFLQMQIGVTDFAEEEKNLQRRRLELQMQLDELERDHSRARTEYDAIVRVIDDDGEAVPFFYPTGSMHGSTIFNTIMALRRKEAELGELRAKYTEDHPQVNEMRMEIERSRSHLKESVRELSLVKRHELDVTANEMAQLRSLVAEVDDRMARLLGLGNQLALLSTQIDGTSKRYETLHEMGSDAAVKEVSYKEYGVEILSPAVSANRNKSSDIVRLALAPLLSLLAGIGLAFYLENLDHSMKTREDVERHLEIPVLASFPDVEQSEANLDSQSRRTPFGSSAKTG